jgi:hypothetical protein
MQRSTFFLAAGTDQAVRFGGKASVTMPVGARAARARAFAEVLRRLVYYGAS